jgi:NhaP-type Na+/H+ or K+/H+ antiporter
MAGKFSIAMPIGFVFVGALAGPKGLVTAQSAEMLVDTAAWTILRSVVLRGVAAVPLANWYGRWLDTANAAAPELAEMPELGVRRVDPLDWLKSSRHKDEEPA